MGYALNRSTLVQRTAGKCHQTNIWDAAICCSLAAAGKRCQSKGWNAAGKCRLSSKGSVLFYCPEEEGWSTLHWDAHSTAAFRGGGQLARASKTKTKWRGMQNLLLAVSSDVRLLIVTASLLQKKMASRITWDTPSKSKKQPQ
eukprot:402427-Pelagomonas_calceolata.AAC.3